MSRVIPAKPPGKRPPVRTKLLILKPMMTAPMVQNRILLSISNVLLCFSYRDDIYALLVICFINCASIIPQMCLSRVYKIFVIKILY